ncbi:MAG: cysteine desulfurase family protein [Peptoniphilus sp.]|nr:cysteine desulfurase family protein [Peptoniphilus sp.]MDD7363513.1 cysteine desulfurase family protein [Bacillota bacterium]MDY6044784.1 cysteine desulfurase family protein [Peptoniphilus sp.]
MIYLDHAATSPLREDVLVRMMPYLTEQFGNPSSLHAPGRAAKRAVETSRLELAEFFGVPMGDVYFTSSGTEADNIAIFSAYAARKASPGHMVTTAIEHEAVLECANYLESLGVDVTYVAPDRDGVVSAEAVANAVREDTFLVSVMAVNNEIGSIQPIEAIRRRLGGDIPLHVDAVQAAGHLPVEMYKDADYIAISGHKFYGPKGSGALISKRPLEPRTFGGGQERGIRSGTENVANIVGLVEAFRLAESERESVNRKIADLSERCRREMKKIDGVHLTVEESDPRIVHATVEGIDRDVLLFQLDKAGIAVSGGSACQAGASGASHVLEALGIDERNRAALRVSLGRENTEEDVREFTRALRDILERKRQ